MRKDRPKRRPNSTAKYKAWPSLALYDRLGVPYVLGNFTSYSSAIWTGHTMMLDITDAYGDAGFYHELIHWMAASAKQRTLPDFGLDRQINEGAAQFTSSTTPWLYRSDSRDSSYRGWGEQCVSPRTASSQESLACQAGGIYGPVALGTTWTPANTRSDANAVPDAFWDFGGHYELEKAAVRRRAAAQLVKVVCEPLGIDVDDKVVDAYLKWTLLESEY